MTQDKENSNSVSRCKVLVAWMKNNKAIGVAFLILMLCFGLLDTLVKVIDNTLLRVTSIERNIWLDYLFLTLSILMVLRVFFVWIKGKKIVSPRSVGLILVPLVLYSYFRIKKSPYVFTSYWNGPIAYLDVFAICSLAIVCLYLYQIIKKKKDIPINESIEFDRDAPIKRPEKDLFNMGSLVNRIVKYIAFTDVNEAAFSIGIVGEWGDGKTSLMNLVEQKIQEDHKDFITINFNPRASKKADFIQEDFLKSLKQVLSPLHSGIDRSIDKYAVALDVIPGMPPIVSKGLELLQVSSNIDRVITRRELSKAIREIDRRIVVFVDDLDRLTGEELIEVLKVLDTNGAFPNMVFLTSFDKDYVNTVLINYLGLEKQKRPYTDKYFTVEIRVPLHPSFRLVNYLVKLLTDASKKGFISLDSAEVEKRTRGMAKYFLPRLRTIRDVKRFANQFLYDYAEIQRDVQYEDFFLLELIKYAHPSDYEALYRLQYIHRGQSSLLSRSSDNLLYLSESLLPKKNKSGEIIEAPEIKPDSIDILKTLFPEESDYRRWYADRYQRIYSVSSFEHYFYNYEYSHLTVEDTNRLFEENSFSDVRKLIDDWAEYSKDMETYLLTRDINSIKDRIVLRRYMQVLLYASHKHQSINYLGQNYCFLRTEDVTSIIRNCSFDSPQDYIAWFKDGMVELTTVNPIIPFTYIQLPIEESYSDKAEPGFYIMSQQQMLDYSLELLNDYCKGVREEGWDARTAYVMSHIQGDKSGSDLPAASKTLHDVIVANFHVFSGSLPYWAEDYDGVHVGYTVLLRFNSVFVDKEEFEQLIGSEENNNSAEIEMIRAIWPFFKANGYSNFVLPKGVSITEAQKTKLKVVSPELSRYEDVNKKMNDLVTEWKKGHNLANVDSFVSRAKDILNDLNAINLKLVLSEQYDAELQDMINTFQEYKNIARDLNEENLRVGDIVKMKPVIYDKNRQEHPDNMIYKENLFTIGNISKTGQLMTRESNLALSYSDIEAVLIDGKEDAEVYYENKGAMATYISPGQIVPASHKDEGYFIDCFKHCYDTNNKSYFELVKEKGFQFVHEVQHWLKDEMHDEGLKVNHSIREVFRIETGRVE